MVLKNTKYKFTLAFLLAVLTTTIAVGQSDTSSVLLLRSVVGSVGTLSVRNNNAALKIQHSVGQMGPIGTKSLLGHSVRQGFIQPISNSVPNQEPAISVGYDVFPNPFNHRVTVSFSEPVKSNIKVFLFDAGGRRVFKKQYKGSQNIILELQGLPKAQYVLRVETATQHFSKKLLKH